MFGFIHTAEQAAAPEPEVHRLPDGPADFLVNRYRLGETDAAQDVARIIFVNGMFESRGTWKQLTENLSRVALQHGQAIELFSYDDAVSGRTAYTQAYRTERLAQVAAFAQSVDPHDRPTVLNAHSRGWITSMEAGADLVNAGHISGVLGTGVAGLVPRTPSEANYWTVADIVQKEILRSAHIGLSSGRGTLQHFISSATPHLLFGGLESSREIQDVLTADVIQETVDLSAHVPMEVWALNQDPYFPGSQIAACLRRNDFLGNVVEINTMHNGPLIDDTLAMPTYLSLTALATPQMA